MASKRLFAVTAVKIVSPQGKTSFFPSGKEFTFNDEIDFISEIPSIYGSGTDSLIVTAKGYQVVTQQEYADLKTAISVTSSTGS